MKHSTSSQQASSGRPDRGAPGAICHKSFDVEIKAVGDDGSFELYCAVFGNLDRSGDIIKPGAFTNLPDFIESGWGAVNHRNSDLPVAMVDTAVQDSHGLKITGVFHSHEDAQKCRTVVAERMARKKKVKCSFGYCVLEGGMETQKGKQVYVITKLEIYEFSFVNLPANPAAEVTAVKSEKDLIGLQTIGNYVEGVKAGKVLSSANHKKLYGVAKALDSHGKAACGIAVDLKDFLAAHGPVDDDEDEEDPSDEQAEGDDEPEEKPAKKKPKETKNDDLLTVLEARRLAGKTTTLCP